MLEILRFIIVRLLEPIYFSLFLIIGKDLKKKSLLFVSIMIFEYVILTSIFQFNTMLQFIYTFMTYINLKVLYKEKAQITDIFLFAVASVILIIISIISYSIVLLNPNNYNLALIINRILIFLLIFIFRKTFRITVHQVNKTKKRYFLVSLFYFKKYFIGTLEKLILFLYNVFRDKNSAY